MRNLFASAVLLLCLQAPAASASEKVEALLKSMTLEEKAALTAGFDGMDARGVPRLGVPPLLMTDGPNGVRWGKTTAFPTGIMLAAAFDEALARSVGSALALEARGRGRDILLGPCVNINRHPFGGRNFESFGEDPHLAARTAVGWIKGLQAGGVAASVKHFAANNQETRRMTVDAKVGERALRELYLPAFEAAVQEAGSLTVMAAYNRLNGPYCSASRWLLQELLKKEWGFSGLVVSDWGATHEGPGALAAGLDLEMPGPGEFLGERLAASVRKGELSEAALDDAARRILSVSEALGALDRKPLPDETLVNRRETQALARQVAEQGAVLLKNENGVLPFEKLKRLAVVGPSAAKARTGGGGSSEISPPYAVSPLEGLRTALAGRTEVLYAPGVRLDEDVDPVPPSALKDLKAEYWDNQDLRGEPKLTRAEKELDADWGEGSPDPALPKDHFSARWTGGLLAPESGDYLLGMRADDGFRLWLDGKLVVEDWGDHSPETRTAAVRLEKGKRYALKAEYYENAGGAMVRLGWARKADLLGEAVAAAKKADAAVVFVGLSSFYESEGSDRSSFSLPPGQDELIAAVAAANPRTAVVLLAGSPVDVEPWVDKVGALMAAWFPGQEGGNALARLLTGQENPSGRLPVTFPKRLQDVPSAKDFPGDEKEVHYREGLYVGYRHYDARGVEPRFPFGHGLSYTRFEYSDLKVEPDEKGARVTLRVRNAGTRPGREVVQLYVRPMVPRLPRPYQELKAFKKVFVMPGESVPVLLDLPERAFQAWDDRAHAWVEDGGAFELRVGASSRDIRLTSVLERGPQPELVWSDEFEQPGLPDPAKWSYDVGGEGWGNQELQYYTEKSTANARVEDGKLVLEARREDFGKNRFTSARLVTRGKGDWTYGLIKVRAKLPKGRGTWPAIWMLFTPDPKRQDGWPDAGEIDIMEHVGHNPGWVHSSIHCKDFNWPMNTEKTAKLLVPDADSAFHEYSLMWRPDRMEFFVDDRPALNFPNDGKGYGSWPFDRPFHLLLNIAVGGMWGGQKGVDEGVFPQRMEVDYVRVYRLPEGKP